VWSVLTRNPDFRRLFISQVTVRTHIASILKKLNAADRDEAIRMFDA